MYMCMYVRNSYLTVTGMHEMHGRMHPSYSQTTILLIIDFLFVLAYFMTHPPTKLPIKTVVARQLPINMYIHVHVHKQENIYYHSIIV